MKKFVCMMLAVLLVCLSAAALAEAPVDQSVIDSFWDTWVGEGDGHYAAEIWYEDGAFHCRGTRHISVDEGYSFEFERCAYDAKAGALVCEGGVLRHELRGEADGKIATEDVATGFGATLTVDEKHHLHWTGSGDALPDLVYASLDEVGEESWYDTHDDGGDDDDESAANSAGDAFVGDWMCERASIYIDEDDNVTQDYRDDVQTDSLRPLPEALRPMQEGIHKLVQAIFDDKVLADTSYTFLLVSPHLENASDSNFGQIDQLYEYAEEHGYRFYCLTASGEKAISQWQDITGAEYPFCLSDETTLKTIIRSNPGLLLIKNGTIIRKWSHNSLPTIEPAQATLPLEAQSFGQMPTDSVPAKILRILTWFVLPLLLLTLADRLWAWTKWIRRKKLIRKTREEDSEAEAANSEAENANSEAENANIDAETLPTDAETPPVDAELPSTNAEMPPAEGR